MLKCFYPLASPRVTYAWAKMLQPCFFWMALLLFLYGLFEGLIIAPPDYQQGDAYRIMFIHVPAAVGSLGIYMVMTFSAFIYLIWRVKVADIVAKSSAPIGALFTALALITGAIWGKPMWGTWWIWDARLTSELILLFIYLGIIVLRKAMPNPQLGAKLSGILTLIGVINIPIIHYSVDWWQTLHQGATILQLSKPNIASSMLYPLLVMLGAFFCYYMALLLLSLQTELLNREQHSYWVREKINDGKL